MSWESHPITEGLLKEGHFSKVPDTLYPDYKIALNRGQLPLLLRKQMQYKKELVEMSASEKTVNSCDFTVARSKSVTVDSLLNTSQAQLSRVLNDMGTGVTISTESFFVIAAYNANLQQEYIEKRP